MGIFGQSHIINPNQAVVGRIPPQAHLTAYHFELRKVMSVKTQCNFLFGCLKQVRIKNFWGLYKKGTPHLKWLSRFKKDFDRFRDTKNLIPVCYINFSKKKLD